MKKMMISILVVVTVFIAVAIGASVSVVSVLTIWNLIPSSESSEEPSFEFLPEESYMEGYELTDHGTVKIRYSICFINNTESDITVGPAVRFRKRELRGWMENRLLHGYDENGEYIKVKANRKENITVIFEGEYLGGPVNENLSFPKTVLLAFP